MGEDEFTQCLDSLEGEPCKVHVVTGGFDGHIGNARIFGFAQGDREYCSFVDDDDMVIPGAMQRCVDYLDAHEDCVGVYTDRQHLAQDGSIRTERLGEWHWRKMYHNVAEITHLKVMRRRVVEEFMHAMTSWPTLEEYVLCCLMATRGRWHHLPILGAIKREKPHHCSSMRLLRSDAIGRAKRTVLPHLLEQFT